LWFHLIKNMFDLIIGNPPYVMLRAMEHKYKKAIIVQWPEIKHTTINLSSIFVMISLRLCKDDGQIWFVINRSILYNIYDSLLINRAAYEKGFGYEEGLAIEKGPFGRYSPQASIIMWKKQDTQKIINIHIPTSKKRLKSSGISVCSHACTGKNSVYILNPHNVNDKYVEIIKEGRKFLLEKGALKNAVKTTRLKSDFIPENVYIIFPYNNEIVPYPPEYMNEKFPMTMNYLALHRNIIDVPEKDIWYVYTRRPSPCVLKPKILVAHTTRKFDIYKVDKADYVHYSGYAIVYKHDINKLYNAIDLEKYKYYISCYAQYMGDGWFSVRGHMIEKALLEAIDFNKL